MFEDYERQRVPPEARRTWWDLTLVYLGVCIAIPSFLLGSALAVGLGLGDTVSATIWGTLIATPICLLASHVGTCTRVSTALTLRLAFGSSGAKLISAIIAVDMFCWFAINTSISGSSMFITAKAVLTNSLNEPVFYIFSGGFITAITVFGYRSVAKLAILAVPLLLVMLASYVVYALTLRPPSEVFQRGPLSTPLSYATAVSIVAGTFLSLSVLMPDFTRYAKDATHAAAAMIVGITLGFPPFVLMGAYLTAATGEPDFVKVMLLHGLGLAALGIVALATWTNMNGCLYSASLNLAAIFRHTDKWKITVFAGLAGTMVALMGILEKYVAFVIVLSVVLPPITGVYTADYLLRRKLYGSADFVDIQPIRPLSLIGLVAGIAAGFLTSTPGELGAGLFHLTYLPAIDSFVVSFGILWIGTKAAGLARRRSAESLAESL